MLNINFVMVRTKIRIIWLNNFRQTSKKCKILIKHVNHLRVLNRFSFTYRINDGSFYFLHYKKKLGCHYLTYVNGYEKLRGVNLKDVKTIQSPKKYTNKNVPDVSRDTFSNYKS